MSDTCPAHITLLDFITKIVFGKEHKLSEASRRITVTQNVFGNYFAISLNSPKPSLFTLAGESETSNGILI